jgi:hypothetical protein
MHEVTREIFSLLPPRPSIKSIFEDTLSREESVEMDLDLDDPKAVGLNGALKKALKSRLDSATIFMRSDERVFMTVYTGKGKFYVEFYEGLNNPPTFEED